MDPYSIVADITRQALKKREDFVIEKLKELGHEFKNKADLFKFAKERLSWVRNEEVHPNKQSLLIDGKTHVATFYIVPEWNEETQSFEI